MDVIWSGASESLLIVLGDVAVAGQLVLNSVGDPAFKISVIHGAQFSPPGAQSTTFTPTLA